MKKVRIEIQRYYRELEDLLFLLQEYLLGHVFLIEYPIGDSREVEVTCPHAVLKHFIEILTAILNNDKQAFLLEIDSVPREAVDDIEMSILDPYNDNDRPRTVYQLLISFFHTLATSGFEYTVY